MLIDSKIEESTPVHIFKSITDLDYIPYADTVVLTLDSDKIMCVGVSCTVCPFRNADKCTENAQKYLRLLYLESYPEYFI